MKTKLILPLVVLIVGMTAMVSAGTLVSPVTGGNYTTLTFTCVPGINNALNASLYYNASGGITSIRLTTITNTSANQTSFSASANIESLSDLTTYNFSCLVSNYSVIKDIEWTPAAESVTIDNTNPAWVVSIDRQSTSVGGIFRYTTTATDATSGVQTKTCTLLDPEGVYHSASNNADNSLYDSDRSIDDGTWTLNCTATDYAGNSKSASDTITTNQLGRPKQPDDNNNKILLLLILGGAVAYFVLKK